MLKLASSEKITSAPPIFILHTPPISGPLKTYFYTPSFVYFQPSFHS